MNCDLRETFLNEGVMQPCGALDKPTLDEALRCWQWSVANSGALASHMLPNGCVKLAQDIDTERAPKTDSPGFFFQDAHKPTVKTVYRDLVCKPDIQRALETLFDSAKSAWFLGEDTVYQSRLDPNDPKHSQPLPLKTATQVLPMFKW